mmetsp:Transcript_12128/g.25493  ORF Transcript_12128/g.25493 Transcript_12128/m.25493 type:complete len:94 (-) Transcript_12128:751-1032(-)
MHDVPRVDDGQFPFESLFFGQRQGKGLFEDHSVGISAGFAELFGLFGGSEVESVLEMGRVERDAAIVGGVAEKSDDVALGLEVDLDHFLPAID